MVFFKADAIHAGIEKKMRKLGNIFTFEDFKNLAAKANHHTVVLPMTFSAFRDFEDFKSQKKVRSEGFKISKVVVARFIKGKHCIYVSDSHDSDDFKMLNIFQKKKLFNVPNRRTSPRGINPAKKSKIIQDLLKLMPEETHSFWRELPENNDSPDLLNLRSKNDP